VSVSYIERLVLGLRSWIGPRKKMRCAKGACLATYIEGAELGVGVSVADALLE
jgi:hypothetical protein